MKKLFLTLVIAGSATAASAQLLGGSVGAGANVGIGDPAGAIGSTVRGATDTAGDAARDVGTTTRDTPRGTVRAASRATDVKVSAGMSTRVDRGTRCYDDGGAYWDPYYRDGYYYCETRSGPGVAASAKVKTGG